MKWDHIGLNQTNYSSLPDGGAGAQKQVTGAALAKMYAQKQVSRQGNSTTFNSKENAPGYIASNDMYIAGGVWMNNSVVTNVGPQDQLLEDDQSRSLSNLMTPMQTKGPFAAVNIVHHEA